MAPPSPETAVSDLTEARFFGEDQNCQVLIFPGHPAEHVTRPPRAGFVFLDRGLLLEQKMPWTHRPRPWTSLKTFSAQVAVQTALGITGCFAVFVKTDA